MGRLPKRYKKPSLCIFLTYSRIILCSQILLIMKHFSILLLIATFLVGVFAAGGGASGANVQPFGGVYTLQTPSLGGRERYARDLRTHLREQWQLPYTDVASLQPHPLTSEQLRAELDHDASRRRFLYLGHTQPNAADMVLATPVRSLSNSGGRHTWALLTAHKGNPPKVNSHGYVTVSNSDQVLQTLGHQRGPGAEGILERGHVLTLPEVFHELSMLQPPSWVGRPPRFGV